MHEYVVNQSVSEISREMFIDEQRCVVFRLMCVKEENLEII